MSHLFKSLIIRCTRTRVVESLFSKLGHPIFMVHRVLPEGESYYEPEMVTSTEVFEEFLKWACEHYEIVPISALVKKIREEPHGGEPSCAITLDDGWRDTYFHAFPLLRKYKVPATVFLAVNFIGSNGKFWQQRLWDCLKRVEAGRIGDQVIRTVSRRIFWYLPLSKKGFTYSRLSRLLLTRSSEDAEEFVNLLETELGIKQDGSEPVFLKWEEVRALRSAGIAFGTHTLNHTLLTRVPPDAAWREIRDSREKLEQELGDPVTGLTYPWGLTSPQVTQQVIDAGYEFALTTERSLFAESQDVWHIPRIAISNNVLKPIRVNSVRDMARFAITAAAFRSRSRRNEKSGIGHSSLPLRIAFVIDRVTGWTAGGSERQLANLIGALDRRYFQPELFVLEATAGLMADKLPFPVHVLSRRERLPNMNLLWDLKRELERFRPQIVQTFFLDATLFGAMAGRLARVPVIVQSRRSAGYMNEPMRKRLLLGIANRLTTSWQCNSRFVVSIIRQTEAIPEDKIEILPNMLDLEYFTPASGLEREAARQKLGLRVGAPLFLSVANLRAVKDPFTLVKAAARVRPHMPDAQFVIIGDGPLEKEVRNQIDQLGLGATVRLEGQQTDVRSWLAATDIGLVTSRSEGSSNALLEYMGTGVPTIASDIPANRELVSGVFFRAGDAADLAEKVVSLWGSPHLRFQVQRQNLSRTSEHSPEAFARRLQSYYVRLVAE